MISIATCFTRLHLIRIKGFMMEFVELIDGNNMLVLTNNEPNNPEQPTCKIINEEFIEVSSFKELLKDFEYSKFANHHIQAGFNSPPKYTYYNINFIDDKYKPLFKEHLTESISGYGKGDLAKHEELNIWIWKEYLSNNN